MEAQKQPPNISAWASNIICSVYRAYMHSRDFDIFNQFKLLYFKRYFIRKSRNKLDVF